VEKQSPLRESANMLGEPQEYKGGVLGRVYADDELMEKIKSDRTARGI